MKKQFLLLFSCMLSVCLSVASLGVGEGLPAAAAIDTTVLETPVVGENLVGAPTVVARLKDEAQLSALSASAPSNLILPFDEAGTVHDGSGREIGTFLSVYNDYVAGVVIPVAEVENLAAADKFVEIWKSSMNFADMAVMSSDAAVLQTVREAIPELRGIYNASTFDLAGEGARYGVLARSTHAMANVVVLSGAQSTPENVNYFQHRLKTVWTELSPQSDDVFAVQNAISSGTYGIISQNYKTVYLAFEKYPVHTLARSSVNIAHRGLPATCAENTVAGAKKAVEGGASHIEIDVHFTKDNVPVIMHDDTIDRTTDGKGTISEMTLDEIRRYHVVKTMGGYAVAPEPIPTVEDIFSEFAGKDVVVVFEIKGERDKSRNKLFFDALLPIVEQYDFWEQFFFISFDWTMLEEARRQMPQVPTAALGNFPSADFEKNYVKYNAINTVVDTSIANARDYDYYDRVMKDRGYMSFLWTYGQAQDCVLAMSQGVYGLTNNAADAFGEQICTVTGSAGQQIQKSDLKVGATVTVTAHSYAGQEKEKNGRVLSLKDCGDYAEVIAIYSSVCGEYVTRAFRVDYKNYDAKKGCGGSIGASVLIVFALGFALVGTSFIRKEN